MRPYRRRVTPASPADLDAGHSLRAGYELRYRRWDITNAPYGAGRYHFNGAYTRANNGAPLNDPAQVWAQFLLGLPTAGTNTVATQGAMELDRRGTSLGQGRRVSRSQTIMALS